MIKITTNQASRSMSGLAASIVAAQLIGNPPYYADNWDSPTVTFRADSAVSTFGTYSNVVSSSFSHQAEPPLVDFYSTLLSAQQRLGAELEAVLYDNLWDLYAR